MTEKLQGYRGRALDALRESKAEVGDLILVAKGETVYEGILIPRSELGDDSHVVVKIKSGYNVGVEVTPTTKITKLGAERKPAFTPPELPEQNRSLPKVAIVSTGGTIASRVDYRTGAVRPAISARDLYSIIPELSDLAVVDTEILFSVFSEDLTPKHWTKLAETVANHVRNSVDGVVVTNGTDTMGYTAAALSFALQSLPVPVVLVGAQRSEDRPSSDAALNLVGAVLAASRAPFAEVAVAMHGSVSDDVVLLHRGTNVRKLHTSRRDAFKTVNAEQLARVSDGKIVMLTKDYMPRSKEQKLVLKPKFEEKVALIKFYPGMSPDVVDLHVEADYRGIVLEGTGLGHVRQECFQSLKKAIKKGVIVAMTSQCVWGRVNMNVYENGRDLVAMGVVPLQDMLAEAALVKLMWSLGQTEDVDEAKKLLTTNLAHEMSERSTYQSKSPNIDQAQKEKS